MPEGVEWKRKGEDPESLETPAVLTPHIDTEESKKNMDKTRRKSYSLPWKPILVALTCLTVLIIIIVTAVTLSQGKTKDQCQENNGDCQYNCTNLVTGPMCSCPTGFKLNPDTTTCSDLNECLSWNGGCDHQCINEPGSWSCMCNLGFNLNTDNKTCQALCPEGFVLNETIGSCYKVFTPISAKPETLQYSLTVDEAWKFCRKLHSKGQLLSIQTDEEQEYIAGFLKQNFENTDMLEGWQGWWTAGFYNVVTRSYQWPDGTRLQDAHFGFKTNPPEDTCIWVLQISDYKYTWGNYACATQSGFICEIEITL